MEIEPGHEVTDPDLVAEHALDEGFGIEPGEGRVKGQRQHEIRPERCQEASLQGCRRQSEDRLRGTEERSGMGLEGDDAPGPAGSLGGALRFGEQCLVAAMHAVEIADGDRCATERGRNRGGGVEDVHVRPQRKVSM
jgi:hypothetical protein